MKKIGEEKLLLGISENNPRNGEGAFLRLKDGRIMYAYTKYCGTGGADHDNACISAVYSSDEGESWSEDVVIFEKPEGALNIMSVSLLRMENGDLGLIYLKKEMDGGNILCMPYLHRSPDEGKSFDGGVRMIDELGYYVLNNDRVIRLKTGRILFTASHHADLGNCQIGSGIVEVYYSDDDGRSFKKASGAHLKSPFKPNADSLMEPGLLELPDGRIWLYIRTGYGYQYESFSEDLGETWTAPVPNYKFTSPSSPMLAKTVGKYTLAILNPMPIAGALIQKSYWFKGKFERTPFVCAVSLDGGLSFVEQGFMNKNDNLLPFIEHCYFIEDDLNESYCYPAIMEVDGGFLLAYYFSNGSGRNLASARITKVKFEEFGI